MALYKKYVNIFNKYYVNSEIEVKLFSTLQFLFKYFTDKLNLLYVTFKKLI